MNEQQSQNVLLKVDPLSTIRSNRLITQDERLETSAKLRVFFIEYIIAVFKPAIYEIQVVVSQSYFADFRTQRNVFIFCLVAHIIHLLAAILGRLTPATYGGIALTFVANFWLGTGALNPFCTSEPSPAGFASSPPS